MRILQYTKAVVIVHGKSEKIICNHIKNKLRLKLGIYSDKKGGKAIQITSVLNILNNTIFKSQRTFLKEYDAETCNKGKTIADNFKIFIIMDLDDCEEKIKESFKNKEMFKNHWAYDYIVPIYNCPKLEDVLTKASVPFKSSKDEDKKKEYIKLFPIGNQCDKPDQVQIEELVKKLRKQKDTNLDVFLDFCLENAE